MANLYVRSGNCLFHVVFLFALLVAAPLAFGQLEWRLSAKIFVDAEPTVTQGAQLRAVIEEWVDHANSVYPRHKRGYQLRLNELIFVVNSTWLGRVPSADNRDELQTAAQDDPGHFRWRTDAINLYVTQPTFSSTYGGYCSRPGDDVMIIRLDTGNGTLVHELGHYFDLCHTHGCSCGPCDPNDACVGSDGIGDTLSDSSCWENADGSASLNQISQANFSINYDQLPANLQQLVLNVAGNVMSYHSGAVIFTPDQLDRVTDTSNDERRNVATGKTWYVDSTDGNDNALYGYFSYDALQTVQEGVTRAAPGEVLLLRANTYFGGGSAWTLTKPVTLRATRGSSTLRRILP